MRKIKTKKGRNKIFFFLLFFILIGAGYSYKNKSDSKNNPKVLAVQSQRLAGQAQGIKVVNDRWPDGSDMKTFSEDAIRLMGAETEQEKAQAIWRFIRMWSSSTDGHVPREPALGDTYIDDPVKVMNVYGAHWCDGLVRVMEVAWRALGNRAEKVYRQGHTQANVYYQDTDGQSRWHLFDVSQGWYSYTRDKSRLATADEIAADYSLIFRPSQGPIPKMPHYRGMWTWIHAPHLAWPTYSKELSLRLGEKITYYFGNIGKPYQDNYQQKRIFDFEHGPYPVTYGNSVIEYAPDVSKRSYVDGAYSVPQNLATKEDDGQSPNLHPAASGKTASVIYQMKYPYIISDVTLSGNFYRKSLSDQIKFSVSTDSGTRWREIWNASETGNFSVAEVSLAEKFSIYSAYLSGFISPFGRYAYLLKIEMLGSVDKTDVGINDFNIKTTVQHNIYSLPQLWPGINNITISNNSDNNTALRTTYIWDDKEGANRQNTTVVESASYSYQIAASGAKWEDVRVKTLTLEGVAKTGAGNRTEIKETAPPNLVNITQNDAFPTDKIVGSNYPIAIKTIDQHIADLSNPSLQVNALAGLIVLKDKKALDAIRNVAFNAISHPNKDLAIQALWQIGGDEALPDMLKILAKDSAVKWKYDASNKFVELQHWYSISGLVGNMLADAGKTEAGPYLKAVLDDIIAN